MYKFVKLLRRKGLFVIIIPHYRYADNLYKTIVKVGKG